jgi:hypothetical protein
MPTLKIKKESPLHRKLTAMIQSRILMAQRDRTEQETIWRKAEERTLAYLPEQDVDATRRGRRDNEGKPVYTTIMLPYSYALLMSAHTYWTSVFFGRSPIHQYSGRHGETENQVQALEALIDYQVEVGRLLGPYYIWLYDAGKYGVGIMGEYWDVEKIAYGQLVEMPDPVTQAPTLMQATVELEGYRGNKNYNINPFDFWRDPRVTSKNFQSGEFCVVLKRMLWNDVQRRAAAGFYTNIDELKKHATQRHPDNNSSQLKRPNWANVNLFADEDPDGRNDKAKHPAAAFAYEFYVELTPNEWGVGPESFPQKWCFTITEDFGLIIGATPLGNMHGRFPFTILEPEVEGYAMEARGIPEIVAPLQNTMDWLVNSHFYNVRAALNNQFIVDPSKLVLKDVEAGEPGFIWRLRPEAFGTDIRSIFTQIPVTDVTRTNMQDLQQMFGLGERTLGINDQIMGVLNTGGRKTATEVRTAAGFGTNRLKTNTEYMSAMGFSHHSQKLVQNSQQFYDGNMKLKIVGDLALAAGPNFLNVTPDIIMGFFNFVTVDGTLPVDRTAQANLWKDMMSNLRMMPPQVAMGFDWVKIFTWVGSLAGLKNINQFKIQVMPPGMDPTQQVQAGNIIPMPGAGGPKALPGANSSTVSGNNAMAPPPPAY